MAALQPVVCGILDVETRLVVLVVDDNADICDLLSEVLHDALACEVRTASDGREALESLRARRPLPDVVVLDWMMPNMSGADVLKAMDEDAALAQVPVMVCSASEVEVPACVPVVRKPVAPEELVAVVRNLAAHAHDAAKNEVRGRSPDAVPHAKDRAT